MKSWCWSEVPSEPGGRAGRGNAAPQCAASAIGRCGQPGAARRGNLSSHLVRVAFAQWEFSSVWVSRGVSSAIQQPERADSALRKAWASFLFTRFKG